MPDHPESAGRVVRPSPAALGLVKIATARDHRRVGTLYEAVGGPATYTGAMGGSESHVQRLHAGEGAYAVEASPRFVQCVVDSFDEAGVPDDPRVRTAVTDYVTWAALGPFQAWGRSRDDVPDDLPLGHFGWDGPLGG